MRRFWAFSAIGVAGFGLQTVLIAWLTRAAGWHYAVAVPVTAEFTIFLSFIWHARFTWADRPARGIHELVARLLRYQGVKTVAMAASYVLTLSLVSRLRLAPEVANTISVSLISIASFATADRAVFRTDF